MILHQVFFVHQIMDNMMKCNNHTKRPKVIMVPYPAQGHVTPMLRLSYVLHSRGFDPVLVTPEHIHHCIVPKQSNNTTTTSFVSIPDGFDLDTPRDFFVIETAMENHMPVHLERLVNELDEDNGVAFMVVDFLASWAIEVGNRCGVPTVGFWPVMLAAYRSIEAIPDLVRAGIISESGIPLIHEGNICLPTIHPMISTQDLPWLIGSLAAKKGRFKFWTRTLDRSKSLRWLLVNTFPDESIVENIEGKKHFPMVTPVGPLTNLSETKSPTFWEEDMSCIDWLDKQQNNSVIYISFGSWVSPIGEAKMKTLATTLESLKRPFLWVINSTWRKALPVNYIERVSNSKQGKVVSWAPQMKVLKHNSIGCYLTHCGWNSTIEAIQSQVPLLCYPVAGDQLVNCKYIVEIWRIGVQLKEFGEEDIEDGLRRVMNDDGQMKERLAELHERTMGEDARSRVMDNLSYFIRNMEEITGDSSTI